MFKVLSMDYTKCHGCRACERACSMRAQIDGDALQPRITCFVFELEGRGISIGCQHCQNAPCLTVCPEGAIYRDEKFNRIMVNHDRCIGCRMCIAVCPFGAMDFDKKSRRIIKCDLCDGDPLCVKLCSYGALQYIDASEQSTTNKIKTADKLREMIQGLKICDQTKLVWW
jgi:carbon-monoxide dehydrogenase iron sulfur subunit